VVWRMVFVISKRIFPMRFETFYNAQSINLGTTFLSESVWICQIVEKIMTLSFCVLGFIRKVHRNLDILPSKFFFEARNRPLPFDFLDLLETLNNIRLGWAWLGQVGQVFTHILLVRISFFKKVFFPYDKISFSKDFFGAWFFKR